MKARGLGCWLGSRRAAWVLASFTLACGGGHARAESADAKPQRCRLVVESSKGTNAGKVLHMMVRRLDAKAPSLGESYEQTAAMVVSPMRDDTVMAMRPLFPGQSVTITLVSHDGERVIAYFFFTRPGENWRVELPRPLPLEVRLELGENQVSRLEVDE